MIDKGYKFRFYPDKEQEELLLKTFGCVRVVYNHFLKIREEAYEKNKTKINYHETSALLTALKKSEDKKWLNEVSCVPLQQSLRHLQTAYINFFRRQNKSPRFKKKSDTQSAEFTKSSFDFSNGRLKLAKMKSPLKIKFSKKLKGEVSSVTVSKDSSNRYFVSFMVKEEVKHLKKLDKTIGIDLGIKDIITTSDGLKIGNPKHIEKYEKKLNREKRRLAKKTKGSKNRAKQKLKVAKIYAKIADTRKDFLHKLSTKIVNENQVICVENLAIKNMVKNHKLAKSISDVGWGIFLAQLEYKSKWYGRTLVKIDRFFPSSKTCSGCGYVMESLPLIIRNWECPSCKKLHDRDINASINIMAVGTTVSACGENVNLVHKNISKSL